MPPPFRLPALAGAAYPGERAALWELLQEYLEEADGVAAQAIDWSRPVGLLSPHIDDPRRGAVCAQVWKSAAQAAQEAELVILVGTDHYGSDPITLTRQHYATPYATLPTDQPLVGQLAAVVGEEAAWRGELRHCGEHSLELVAVWLHHLRAGKPVPAAPILAGSFYRFLADGSAPEPNPALAGLLAILGDAAAQRRTPVVASGDLAHVGPAFGGAPLDAAARACVRAADHELIRAMAAGDSRAFLAAIRWEENRNNVCGATPIDLAMRLLGDRPGHLARYAACPFAFLSWFPPEHSPLPSRCIRCVAARVWLLQENQCVSTGQTVCPRKEGISCNQLQCVRFWRRGWRRPCSSAPQPFRPRRG